MADLQPTMIHLRDRFVELLPYQKGLKLWLCNLFIKLLNRVISWGV